jgi:short-subunit dehydrogenase
MKVFITGASSGIGQALARQYAVPGGHVGLVARRRDELERLAAELRERGASATVYALDVADTEAMRGAAQDFAARAGCVDRVIANAGIGIPDTLRDGDAASVARLMSVNVIGMTNTIVPFLPILLRQRSGTLVAVSSMAGHRAWPGRAAYSASKAAVITFMDALRMQLVSTGVHAMTLCPGYVRTPLTATLRHAMPFLLEADEAARLMVSAIEQKKKTHTLPWQMDLLKHLMVNAPEWLLRRVAPPPRPDSVTTQQ